MGNLVDIAAAVLSQSERRVEMSGQNISNITTPGYKRRVSFESFLAPGAAAGQGPANQVPDLSPGKLTNTGNPYDLAIAGTGFFAVTAGGRTLYTRQGQFQRGAEGRLETAQGFAVQAEDGGDITLKGGAFKVLDDGTIEENGEPLARLAVVDFADPKAVTFAEGGLLSAADGDARPAKAAMLRQGMLEASNVSMGDEMVAMMEAVRRAESGQRLVGVYDDLMGRVLQSFGQN